MSGPVQHEVDAYFATRNYRSRLGAWASPPSRPLPRFAGLERAAAAIAVRYPRSHVPRPPHRSGFRVFPEGIELSEENPFRLQEHVRCLHPGQLGWRAELRYSQAR